MNRIDSITVKRVLNNKGTRQEAEAVARWFSTPEGQEWLSEAITNDSELIDRGIMAIADDIPADEILARIMASIRRKQRRRVILSCAAALIPCILLVTMWFNINDRIGGALSADAGMETVTTGRGEQKEIVFQDGTSVILNGESSLTYPHRFGISKRSVSLDGEAYFKVSPNKRRAFTVELAGESSVKVLGTTFNINSYGDSPIIGITLMSGSVEFRNKENVYGMQPDQYLAYDKQTGKVRISRLKDSNVNALWTENIIIFQDTAIEDVLHTLQRRFDCDFEIADEKVRKCSYTMKIQKGTSLETVMDDMESISPIRFVKENGLYKVHSTEFPHGYNSRK